MVYTDGTSLVADTIEELHTFAHKCGVFTFLDHRRRPHYIVEKTSLPTVKAHGVKWVSEQKLFELSNAMAKKRDNWFIGATDEQIRERVEKFAPFERGAMIYYEGQDFSQQEMFDIMFEMYKDMRQDPARAEEISKRYKLPKVLPLSPRVDPPTDRDNLAQLYNSIEQGKSHLKEIEAGENRDEEYIDKVKARIAELQAEHDTLELKVQQDAIEELTKQFDIAQTEVDNLGTIDVSNQEHRDKLSKRNNLRTQLEALTERFKEILAKSTEEVKVGENQEQEEPDYLKDNPTLTVPEEGTGEYKIGYDHGNPEREPVYKAMFDPADPQEGESFSKVDVTKSHMNDPLTPGETIHGITVIRHCPDRPQPGEVYEEVGHMPNYDDPTWPTDEVKPPTAENE